MLFIAYEKNHKLIFFFPKKYLNYNFYMSLLFINSEGYLYFPDNLKNDYQIIYTTLKNCNVFSKQLLNHISIPYNFKENREIVKLIMNIDGEYLLEYSKFQNDEEIVLIAVTNNGYALKYACESFKKNKKFIIPAIKNKEKIYKLIDKNLQNDLEIIETLLTSHGIFSMSYIDKKFLNDKNFALKYLKIEGLFLQFFSMNLRNDIEVVETALKNNPKAYDFVGNCLTYKINDVKKIIKLNAFFYKNISPKLKNNDEIINLAIEKDGIILEFVPKKKITITLCFKALENNAFAYSYILEEMKNSFIIIMYCLEKCPILYNYIPEHFKNNYDIILKAGEERINFLSINKKIRESENFVKYFIKLNPLKNYFIYNYIKDPYIKKIIEKEMFKIFFKEASNIV
jgi:hypothetical protein